jgi:VWFA-related protein
MVRAVREVVAAGLVVLLAGPSAGQQAGHQHTFSVDTQVVMLDLVVRDKKGRSVRDLRPEEVTVLEDGEPQEIVEFRLVGVSGAVDLEAGEAVPSVVQPRSTPGAATPSAALNLVTLVFDRLGPEGRRLARQAGHQFLDQPERSDLWISVFYVGNGLHLLQQFTTDRESIRRAVDHATGMAEETLDAAGDDLEGSGDSDAAQRVMDQASAGTGAPPAGVGDAAAEAAMQEMTARAVAMTRSLRRQQKGHSSLYGLLALARQQQRMAGRKTMLYFSEGLEVPPELEGTYRATISEANRSNVSIYTVDARGLLTTSDVGESRDELLSAMRTSERQQRRRGGATTRAEVMIADTAEGALRANVQETLGALAEETGAVMIANTNDTRRWMSRVASDLQGYYEVVYAPKKVGFDGKFRKIEVKVARKGVSVQTRSGYYALPPGEGDTVFPYQVPLVAALRADNPPRDFPQRRVAYHFGREGEALQHTLVIEVPLGQMRFEKQEGRLRVHFSFMARVRDKDGRLVEQLGQDSPIEVPEAQREALEQGNVVFTRSLKLPPGLYTLETAVVDQLARTSSVIRSPLTVAPRQLPELSSVALIKRTELVAEGALESDDAFRVGDTRLVPHVEEPEYLPIDTLMLFFVAFPAEGAKPEASLEFRRDGQVVGRSRLELPDPDGQGAVPYIAPIPAQSFAPGRYEVRVVLRQGQVGVSERSFFKVVEAARGEAAGPAGAGS